MKRGMKMEWTKIPTDLIQIRSSDKEIIAITKYQLIWAMIERRPTDEICLRYMTAKQLQIARQYDLSIECRVNADIKSVESHRNRQKLYYTKNQTLKEKTDGQHDGQDDGQCDAQTDGADKIRLDKSINNIPPLPPKQENRFDEFWETYKPVTGRDGTKVAKGSRSRCQEKYEKVIKSTDEEKIITGLKKYLDYCEKNKLCSCGAEVFLNQKRWENEYEEQTNEEEGKEFWAWMKSQTKEGEKHDTTI